MNGTGWRVRAKGGKVQVTRADEEGRSLGMLDLPWHPNSKLKILAAVEQLHKRMIQLGCSLRRAHDLANNGGHNISRKLDWFAVRVQFLETVADRRAATKKDIAFRAQRTLEAMESKPRPKDGTEVLLRYADLVLALTGSGPYSKINSFPGRSKSVHLPHSLPSDSCSDVVWREETHRGELSRSKFKGIGKEMLLPRRQH